MLGRKVSIRYKLHDDEGHPFSEAVGVVMSVEPEAVTILKRTGDQISVGLADILAAKIFPL